MNIADLVQISEKLYIKVIKGSKAQRHTQMSTKIGQSSHSMTQYGMSQYMSYLLHIAYLD